VENGVALAANCTFFNSLLLFAQFQCSAFLHGAVFARARSWSKRKARKIKSLRGLNTKILAAQCSARLNFTLRKNY
jgi:hypothetical protein